MSHDFVLLKSDTLKNDRGVVLAAVKQNRNALMYASDALKKDPKLIRN